MEERESDLVARSRAQGIAGDDLNAVAARNTAREKALDERAATLDAREAALLRQAASMKVTAAALDARDAQLAKTKKEQAAEAKRVTTERANGLRREAAAKKRAEKASASNKLARAECVKLKAALTNITKLAHDATVCTPPLVCEPW